MFSIYNKILVILFIVFTIADINNINENKEGKYYAVEKQVGTYNDIVFLAVIIMFMLEKLQILNAESIIVVYMMNLLMMLIYCGFTKTILQTIHRVKYIIVNDDSSLNRKTELKAFTKRILTIFPYIILVLVFRNILFSGEPLFTKHIIGSLLAVIIAKSLSKANFKISTFTSSLKDNQ